MSKVDESSHIIVAAFQDSLAESVKYPAGICGEKRFFLAAGTPSYLSVQYGSSSVDVDLTFVPFLIVYNSELSLETDAGVHLIDYAVIFLEYADCMPVTTGSFEFELEETCSRTTLVENEKIDREFNIRVFEPRIIIYKYLAYTDEISDLVGQAGTCGDIVYTVLD